MSFFILVYYILFLICKFNLLLYTQTNDILPNTNTILSLKSV